MEKAGSMMKTSNAKQENRISYENDAHDLLATHDSNETNEEEVKLEEIVF